MRDICVDLEATSTDPYHGAIVQIGAVKFDLFTGEIGETFNVSLKIPKNRFWGEGTRSFWGEHLQLFNSITENAVEPKEGFASFIEWVHKTPDPHFWANPITFDSFQELLVSKKLVGYALLFNIADGVTEINLL